MTREEKIEAIEKRCVEQNDTCEGCPFDTSEMYGCDFREMNDAKIDELYERLKMASPRIRKNTGIKSCDTEPDDLKPHIDSKVAKHYAICQKLNAVYKAKNHDYGDSFGDTFKKLGIISAVTRLSDKMNRLMSLAVAHDAQVKDEKIEDTLLDMANYAIMTLIELGYEPEN